MPFFALVPRSNKLPSSALTILWRRQPHRLTQCLPAKPAATTSTARKQNFIILLNLPSTAQSLPQETKKKEKRKKKEKNKSKILTHPPETMRRSGDEHVHATHTQHTRPTSRVKQSQFRPQCHPIGCPTKKTMYVQTCRNVKRQHYRRIRQRRRRPPPRQLHLSFHLPCVLRCHKILFVRMGITQNLSSSNPHS